MLAIFPRFLEVVTKLEIWNIIVQILFIGTPTVDSNSDILSCFGYFLFYVLLLRLLFLNLTTGRKCRFLPLDQWLLEYLNSHHYYLQWEILGIQNTHMQIFIRIKSFGKQYLVLTIKCHVLIICILSYPVLFFKRQAQCTKSVL